MDGDTMNVKRAKMEENDELISSTAAPITCKFFVKRKQRYCRLTPPNGEEFCGQHMPVTSLSSKVIESDDLKINKSNARVPCPLDPKHTVCAWKLHKHLKICNAVVKDRPCYIVPGMNAGNVDVVNNDAYKSGAQTEFKLTDIDYETIDKVVARVNQLYDLHKIDEKIDDLMASHPLLAAELNNKEYGHETRRHLIQTSTILGYLNHYKLYDDKTSYIEYGAGKGQVSYWLAQAITNYPNSNVLLIDRASVRHKKDNKLDETHAVAVQRIRADIADFDISAHNLIQKSNKIVGLGKHLCGAATDFAIRCTIHGNNAACENGNGPKTIAMLIALCCHHRCEWKYFVGRDFFMQNKVSEREFAIMTKMVGWAICGTGLSREKRKEIEERKESNEHTDEAIQEENVDANITNKRDRHQRKEIGQKCKRLIDFARICYLEQNGFKCSLKRYVSSDITLENVCLVALHETK
ncbi:tRNA:m(4)X modification enzyme TRM13 homolog [Contarinia nasturtii]|uniref:tRNA:m(4)X modification enzyme TRM13 homolog n=1 Tax=Contarinia nasturtii TaxID=265458 RepID=UPI0012D3C29E|nr:tRNA:m(4)X modification enzyme TRM13 homolog [Contarinia nasturtii]